ncbi:MAG: chemotaxis protein CheX [Bryobacterales bacterium]|nr:chemotaxis protein CheX [Bryobacterales bacterium]
MEESIAQDKLVEFIRDASCGVFQTMLGLELSPLAEYTEVDPAPTNAGILSLVGFAGTWAGTGAFICSVKMACRIADALFLSEHESVEEEVLDAVGEMTNMILGNVKTELEEILGPMALSIPTVLFGHDFIKRNQGKHEWTVVPFDFEGERIEVQVCLSPNQQNEHARHAAKPHLAGV